MHRGVKGSIATSNLMDAYCSVWLRISYPPDKAHLGVWTTERQTPEKVPKKGAKMRAINKAPTAVRAPSSKPEGTKNEPQNW